MRKVWVYKYIKGGKVGDGEALFHTWGTKYEEFETGPGNYSTAIIERSDGTVENVEVELIRFLDCGKIEKMDACEFMRAMMFAPFDYSLCPSCGGVGLTPVRCCSGGDCGCLGHPVDYTPCTKCGVPGPTEKQLRDWHKEFIKQLKCG